MLKYAAAVALLLAAGPAFAQAGATQTPPAPQASSAAPTPPTSVPPGASNVAPNQSPNVAPGISTTTTQPAK